MTRIARRLRDLVNLGARDITGKYAANALAIEVDFQHDLGRHFTVFAEKLLNHVNHELHRSEVVVQQRDLVHLRRLGALGAALENDRIVVADRRRGNGHFGFLGFLGGHKNILAVRAWPPRPVGL